jgi:hypothetical protein
MFVSQGWANRNPFLGGAKKKFGKNQDVESLNHLIFVKCIHFRTASEPSVHRDAVVALSVTTPTRRKKARQSFISIFSNLLKLHTKVVSVETFFAMQPHRFSPFAIMAHT